MLTYRPKGKAEERRPIPATAWRPLWTYLQERGEEPPDTRVFDLTGEGYRYITRQATRRAVGRPMNPHELRHTAAFLLWKLTGRLADVQELLGHSRATTTEIYIHALEDDRRGHLGDVIGDALGL